MTTSPPARWHGRLACAGLDQSSCPNQCKSSLRNRAGRNVGCVLRTIKRRLWRALPTGSSRTQQKIKNGWCWRGGRPWPPKRMAGGDARPTAGRPAPPSYFHTNLPSHGGTGFQPVQAQAEACGYQTLPYDCGLVSVEQILSPQPVEGLPGGSATGVLWLADHRRP